MILVAPRADRQRGAALLPDEDDRWDVIYQGVNAENTPTDCKGVGRVSQNVPGRRFERFVCERE